MTPVLLDIRRVASVLSISPATVWRRVADGSLPPPIKLGGATRWRADEIAAAVDRLAEEQRRGDA